jgi:hypothetical protein
MEKLRFIRILAYPKSITKNITHQALPSVSITPKCMTYRDTAYLKMLRRKKVLNPDIVLEGTSFSCISVWVFIFKVLNSLII